MTTESRKSRTELLQSQILELHNAGLSVPEMASKMGLTRDGINYHRYQLGLKRYSKKITPEIRTEVFKLKQSGLDNDEIANQLMLHKSTVRRVLKHSDTSTFSFTDMMSNPVNKLLACRWSTESVRNCLV